MGRVAVVQAHAVVVAEHGGARAALRPVAAGHVRAAREGGAVALRAGEDVVSVRGVAAAVHELAFLVERGLLVQVVRGAVQLRDAVGDHHALGVAPRPAADAVARVDRAALGVGAQIGMPGVRAGADAGGERLAVPVGAGEAAEVRALAAADARHEERHRVVGATVGARAERDDDDADRRSEPDRPLRAWAHEAAPRCDGAASLSESAGPAPP